MVCSPLIMSLVVVDEQKSVSVENWSTHVMKLHVDTNLGFAQEYDVSWTMLHLYNQQHKFNVNFK